MLRLHDHVLSAESYAVRLMLALLGVRHEIVSVDAYPGKEQVPILFDGDDVFDDTGLILVYLARSHGSRWLPPTSAAEEVAGWLAFAATKLRPLADARRVATLGQDGELGALNALGRQAMRLLEDTLTLGGISGRDWVMGTTPSVADIAIFPHIVLSHDSGIGHEDFPAINLWQRRVRQLPGFIGMPGIPDYF